MVYSYLILFILSIAMGIALLYIGRRQNMTSYALMFMMMSVSMGGYFALAVSSSLEMALLANDIVYFGNTMALAFFLLCISKLTDVKVPLVLYTVMCAFGLFVTALVCTAGHSELYYKGCYLLKQFGVSNIGQTSFGPLHNLYYVLLGTYAVIVIILLIYSKIRNKRTSYINIWLCFGAELVSVLFYAVELIIPEIQIELVPFGMMIGEVFSLLCIYRLNRYDISDQIKDTMQNRTDYGYVLVDEKLRFLSSDPCADEFLPVLKELEVDCSVKRGGEAFYQDFLKWIEEPGKSSHFTTDDGREICVTSSPIMVHNRLMGYLLDLHDDTPQRRYIRLLDNYNTELKMKVDQETHAIQQMQMQIIYGMAAMIEGRDESTGDHIYGTSRIVSILREELERQNLYTGYAEARGKSTSAYWSYVEQTAPLHDLGKITVDDSILRKPGRLTTEEFDVMKTHTTKGAKLIDQMFQGTENDAYREIAMNIAQFHHERWDGSGYPDGLKGEEIPLEARLMAVADVYDALCSKRCYKEAYSWEKTEAIMEAGFGSQFDPSLKPVFEACLEKLRKGEQHRE